MIDAVKMDVEEQNGHLAESEVARLLAVLQNAEFKRSETRNITKDHSFKPRSLMEIAIEAQQRDAEIEAVKQAEEALAAAKRVAAASACKTQADKDQNSDEPDFVDSDLADADIDHQGTALGSDDDGALMHADGTEDARLQSASTDNPPSPISDAAPNAAPDSTPDIGSGNQASEASDILANDAPASDAVDHDSTADNGEGDTTEGTPVAANFETVTAAFERGKAEGMIAGRDAGIAETKAAAQAAAQANLADKIAAFEAA
ncbi:MAG: hypothetical protein L7S62_08640, partial [Flavobacteriales bacterium]|nr:hypothetical protein [Flavobacteriales bacterium]